MIWVLYMLWADLYNYTSLKIKITEVYRYHKLLQHPLNIQPLIDVKPSLINFLYLLFAALVIFVLTIPGLI